MSRHSGQIKPINTACTGARRHQGDRLVDVLVRDSTSMKRVVVVSRRVWQASSTFAVTCISSTHTCTSISICTYTYTTSPLCCFLFPGCTNSRVVWAQTVRIPSSSWFVLGSNNTEISLLRFPFDYSFEQCTGYLLFDNQKKEEFFLGAAANVLTILFRTLYGLCLTGNDWD